MAEKPEVPAAEAKVEVQKSIFDSAKRDVLADLDDESLAAQEAKEKEEASKPKEPEAEKPKEEKKPEELKKDEKVEEKKPEEKPADKSKFVNGRFDSFEKLQVAVKELVNQYVKVQNDVVGMQRSIGDTVEIEEPVLMIPASSPQEVEAFYKDMEAKYTKATQKRSELRKKQDLVKAQQEEEFKHSMEPDKFFEKLTDDPEALIAQAIKKHGITKGEVMKLVEDIVVKLDQRKTEEYQVQQQALREAQAKAQSDYEAFKSDKPDIVEIEQDMARFMQEELTDKFKSGLSAKELLKFAYETISNRKLRGELDKIKTSGSAAKEKVTVESANGSGSVGDRSMEQTNPEDDIADSIVKSKSKHYLLT